MLKLNLVDKFADISIKEKQLEHTHTYIYIYMQMFSNKFRYVSSYSWNMFCGGMYFSKNTCWCKLRTKKLKFNYQKKNPQKNRQILHWQFSIGRKKRDLTRSPGNVRCSAALVGAPLRASFEVSGPLPIWASKGCMAIDSQSGCIMANRLRLKRPLSGARGMNAATVRLVNSWKSRKTATRPCKSMIGNNWRISFWVGRL